MSRFKVEQDKNIHVNWGTFNVPTIIGMVGLFIMTYNFGATNAAINARVGSIETFTIDSSQHIKRLDDDAALTPNIIYRLTSLETKMDATNTRIDRQSEIIGDLREAIGKLNTSIELLNQRLESYFAAPGMPDMGMRK